MKPCLTDYLSKIKQEIQEVSIDDLRLAQSNNSLILDIREPQEHQQGIIDKATPLPRGLVEFKIFDLPQLKNLSDEQALETPVYVYCASGGRSACSVHALQQLGFTKVFSVNGGIKQWTESGGELTKP